MVILIHVRNISKKIKGKEVIKNITFSVLESEVVALVGPNGSGKTTLFKIMTSLLKQDEGTIIINNFDSQKNRTVYLSKLSIMQDSTILYADLTGYDHLKFVGGITNKAKEDLDKVISDLGIGGYIYKKIKTYSLGMKQFLLLGLSILINPKVLILDEPLNGLDPTSAEKLREIIKVLQEKGTTIIFSSHNLSEVDKLADRVFFLRKGELIHTKKIENNNDIYCFTVSSKQKMIDILQDNLNVISISPSSWSKHEDVQVVIKAGDLNGILKEIMLANIDIKKIVKVEQYSEDIYQKLYEEKL